MYMLKGLRQVGQLKQDILGQVKVGQVGQGRVRYHVPTCLFTTYLPTYLFMTCLPTCLPFYNLPTDLPQFLKKIEQKFEQSNGLKKRQPQSQQACRNRLVQNDKIIFLMLVQSGYFFTRFASKKIPCFLLVRCI